MFNHIPSIFITQKKKLYLLLKINVKEVVWSSVHAKYQKQLKLQPLLAICILDATEVKHWQGWLLEGVGALHS
jgi:hypothetical protein